MKNLVSITPLLLALTLLSNGVLAAGHTDQPKCEFCQMPLLKDTQSMDYRVTLTVRGKSTSYRCVLCALAQSKEQKGDLQIDTASEKKGHGVHISRIADKWTVTPETAVFVYAEGDHEQCETRYRALTSADAMKDYIGSNPKILKNAKQVTLAQLLKLAG